MDRWSAVKGNFDVGFGEVFTILPMVKPANGRPAPDPAREPTDFVGVFRDPHFEAYPHSPGHADSDVQRFAEGKPTVDFDRAALPFPVTLDSDIVVRKATGDRATISDVADDGFVRIKVALTAWRRGP